jgi:excinuclease ABC subunit C
MTGPDLSTLANSLPQAPGVYLFRDQKGDLLYVGKAKDLRKRVWSYFQRRESDVKTSVMLSRLAVIDHMVTQTEKEALILEDILIKEHRPRYNIRLRDDKRYPSLRLSIQEKFPRLNVVRRTKKDGALYFGPFPSAASVRETLKAIQKVFPLRSCSPSRFSNRSRPCINFQMQRCSAPCCQEIDKDDYSQLVQQVHLFLEGKSDYLMKELHERMKSEAEALNFERAARIRDRLISLERIIEKQKVVSQNLSHRDVIALWRQGAKVGIQVLFIRGGRLLGGKFFIVKDPGLPDHEIFSSFLRQFYREGQFIPSEIIVSSPLEDTALLEDVLRERIQRNVKIHHPRKGKNGYDLLQMALENIQGKLAGQLRGENVLKEMAERFHLTKIPYRIEGFDISNLGGGQAVGSKVVFKEGDPVKSYYRRYRIKAVEGIDDYAMTYEVLLRRLRKGKEEGDLPDLILIDGGKGQLNIALEVLKELKLDGVDALSLAKKRKPEKKERVFLSNRKEPIILRGSDPSSLLLQRIRDEAHRFAIEYHKRLRKKKGLTSVLDEIPGIGETRKRALLEHIGGLKEIRGASMGDLAKVPGMNYTLAQKVLEHLRKTGVKEGVQQE